MADALRGEPVQVVLSVGLEADRVVELCRRDDEARVDVLPDAGGIGLYIRVVENRNKVIPVTQLAAPCARKTIESSDAAPAPLKITSV